MSAPDDGCGRPPAYPAEVGIVADAIHHPAMADVARVFAEPWNARIFALTLALSERQLFSLGDFQAALIARVSRHETTASVSGEADYYTLWMAALEDLLGARDLLPRDRLHDLEHVVSRDAASRRAHQHIAPRDANGRLAIAPIVVDAAAPDPA